MAALTIACSSTSGFLVRDAELASGKSNTEVLEVHRITAGGKTVVAFRGYDAGSGLVLDDESFQKLTLELDHPLSGADGTVDFDGAKGDRGYWSRGAAAFPARGCRWAIDSGHLAYRWESGEAVRIEFTPLALHLEAGSKSACGDARIPRWFSAVVRELADLSEWDGRAGSHPYDESYP